MSTDDLRWLVGIAVTFFLAMFATAVGVFRSLSGRIDTGDRELRKEMKDGDDALHERVNRVRDEYVRRVDLDERFRHFQETLSEIRGDLKAIRADAHRRRQN